MAKLFNENDEISEISTGIKNGKIAIFPTETVYGIGANALNESAVKKIFVAKGRPSDNPLIVHISDFEMLNNLVNDLNEIEKLLVNKFWPGPLTVILKKKDIIPNIVTCGMDTVGIRMPNNKIALSIIKKAGVPIAAPSANISGRPSGTNISDIFNELNDKVDYIIDGGNTVIGLESTVVKVDKNIVKILRPGKISPDDIAKLGLEVKLDTHIFENVKNGEIVESPGMKHKHYAPNILSYLVFSEREEKMIKKIQDIINENLDKKICVIGCEEHRSCFMSSNYISYGKMNNLFEISQNMFTVLRKVDNLNCDMCIIEGVEKKSIGIAIMNRLIRACGYNYLEI